MELVIFSDKELYPRLISMLPENSRQLLEVTGLKQQHFADLVRIAQIVFDPSGGLSGRRIEVNWSSFEMPPGVVANLASLGDRYQFSSPYVVPHVLWEQLTSETRAWLIENKSRLAELEESFPARDED